MKKYLIALLLLLAVCASAQKRVVNWHHNLSPFRGVFSLKTPGNPKAGALIHVPVCGTCQDDGANVFCYDENGKALMSKPLGIGVQNCALVQVMPDKNTHQILAYFGSEQRSPVAKFELPPALCQVYSISKSNAKNWAEISKRLTPSALLGQLPIDSFVQGANLVDSREVFAMVMTAKLNITRDGVRNLFLVSSDAGYLFIDGELLIARDGVHYFGDTLHGENRKPVNFKQGYHDIKLVGVNLQNEFVIAAAEWFPAGNVNHLPNTVYVQPTKTSLVAVEAHKRDAPIPIFKYTHISDLPLEDRHLTITEFETFGGSEATWTFSDGVQLTGAKVKRVFGNLETLKVRVKAGRNEAGGTVMFPQLAPDKVESTDNQNSYSEFDKMITKEMISKASLDVLLALMEFYSRKDLHPKQMDVAEAIMKKENVPQAELFKAYLMLARSASLVSPDKALKAYNEVLQYSYLPKEQFQDILCEAFEFLLFGRRDIELAEKLVRRYASKLQKKRKVLLALQFDLALQSGELEEARKLYQELLEGRTKAMERRTAAVQGNSIQANVSMLLERGRILEAEAAMRDWIDSSPQDRANGSYSLERARCFRKRGWAKGAIGELTAAIQADPLLPNLPDVEFELAMAYGDAGENDKAQELFKKISTDYPNHRLAEEAKKHIGK